MRAISAVELVVIAIGIAGLIVWIWALTNAVSHPDAEWRRAGRSKLIWILLLIFFHVLASIVYLLAVRPRLERARPDL